MEAQSDLLDGQARPRVEDCAAHVLAALEFARRLRDADRLLQLAIRRRTVAERRLEIFRL